MCLPRFLRQRIVPRVKGVGSNDVMDARCTLKALVHFLPVGVDGADGSSFVGEERSRRDGE